MAEGIGSGTRQAGRARSTRTRTISHAAVLVDRSSSSFRVPRARSRRPTFFARTDEPLRIALPTRRETRRLGARLASLLRPGDAVFLEGPLGAGKTFLVRAIARALGVPAREPIQSPTFALVHAIASGRVPIVHADLYRLGEASELDLLALPEAISRAIVLIEWGERFAPAIASDGIVIAISLEGTRSAAIRALGPRGEALSAALAGP